MNEKQKTKLVTVLDILRAKGWEPGHDTGWGESAIDRNYGVIMRAGLSMKNMPLACVACEILACEQPDTVRGVMYRCVSAGWLPDTSKRSYGQIQRLLVELRKKGVIPYSWIVDNIRTTEKASSWSGLEDFADTVSRSYRKNFWASLPDYVCVIVEKDTIAGRISEVTREYDIPMHPLRGFSSASFAWGIGEDWRKIEKPIHALYIGDHDPSGYGIEKSIRENLVKFSGRDDFTWERLAVKADQFEQFNILPLAVKHKDKRAAGFIKLYGEACAEVEAVPASALRDMVRDAIESHIPQDQWAKLKAIEAEEKKSWHEVMAKIGGRK